LSGPDTTIDFVPNQSGTGGTLVVSDGAHSANIHLAGQYSAEAFHLAADASVGTIVTYLPPITPIDHVL
jgi:hypothetical protein